MIAKPVIISFIILLNVLHSNQSITKTNADAPVLSTLQKAEQRISGTGCDKKADIVFVLDASHAYKEDHFQRALTFINSVVSTLKISFNTIRVGMVIYSTHSFSPFDLDDYNTLDEIQSAIKNVSLRPGVRNTPEALQRAFSMLWHAKSGARPFTEAQHILILMTDGPSVEKLYYNAVNTIHEASIESYGIGISNRASFDQLVTLVSFPRYQHLYMIESYVALTSFVEPFSKQLCTNIYAPGDAMAARYLGQRRLKRTLFNFKWSGPELEGNKKSNLEDLV